ncbi:MAG: heme exporter protein B [Oceanicoccus sp.]|jgi:heme exporter protein B
MAQTSSLMALFKRDLLIAFRNRGELLNPLMFFLMVTSLFPLAVTPDPKFLGLIAPGIIWVGALLATLLSLDLMFKSDYEDGSLEQMLLLPQPTLLFVMVKTLLHWLTAGLPLTLMAPLLGVMLALPEGGYWPLICSLLLGTPILSLLGSIGAGLTVGLKKGGMLMPLLILPLYIPVLIFAASSVQAGVDGNSYTGHVAFLGAYLALMLVLAPVASAAALRISIAR